MPTKIPKAESKGEETLAVHLRALKVPYIRKVRFARDRKWEFDFAVPYPKQRESLRDTNDTILRRLALDHGPELFIAIEVDGGNRMVRKGAAVGRHTGEDDYRKLNAAAKIGWRVLRVTPDMVDSGEALSLLIPDGELVPSRSAGFK